MLRVDRSKNISPVDVGVSANRGPPKIDRNLLQATLTCYKPSYFYSPSQACLVYGTGRRLDPRVPEVESSDFGAEAQLFML